MEENLINNNTEPEVKEEMEAAEAEDEDEALAACDNISPKQCQKLQFSIAQIMGFEAGEPRRAEDVKLEVGDAEEAGGARPVKLWRPLAQPPPAAPVSALSPVFAADQAPGPAPAALALLRHYTLFR